MTSLKKLVGALALIGAATGAQAATINNLDGSYSFSGFDWDSFGSVLISGYDLTAAASVGTSDPFTLTYQAFATNIKDADGNNLANALLPNFRQGTGAGYEYTVVVSVNEVATLIASDGTSGAAQLSVLGGNYSIYYQAVGNADRVNGTGFTDGTKILGGTILNTSPSILAAQGLTNPGNLSLSASLKATVDFQDLTFISPLLGASQATTTLQFGDTKDPQWARPGEVGGVVVGPLDTNTDFVAQADGNQSFKVPEPASAALVGVALAGLGFSSRRSKSK